MYQRVHPVRDEEARRAWMRQHGRCQCCGKSRRRADLRGLHCHHIVKFGRSDEPTNWLCLCADCHDRAHGIQRPKLTLSDCCRLKRVRDPEEFDLARLEELYGSPIPIDG